MTCPHKPCRQYGACTTLLAFSEAPPTAYPRPVRLPRQRLAGFPVAP